MISDPTLVVTFDDAHRSVREHALPVMKRLGLPGTVFAPTAYAGTDRLMGWDGYDMWLGTEHEEELRCMSWDDLNGLVEEGWEVGSHTRTHPHLSRLGDDEIAEELAASRQDCVDRTGRACRVLAYPYSDYDERAVRAASEAGYLFAVTVPRGPREPRPFEWPRVGVYRDEGARRVQLRTQARRYHRSWLSVVRAPFGAGRR